MGIFCLVFIYFWTKEGLKEASFQNILKLSGLRKVNILLSDIVALGTVTVATSVLSLI